MRYSRKIFHDRTKLEFHSSVIHLVLVQTSRVACKDLIPLHYDASDLITAGVCINVKWLLEIGKREQDRLRKRFLNIVKRFRVTG